MAAATARFGIVFLPESLPGFGELCRAAEDSGFDWLGVADSQSVFRELYVALTVAALHTSRVRLGPLVTNPLTRHPVVTASAIASVDELSGGRTVLGLGAGDSAIYTIGAPPATVAGLEDAVATLGRLTAGLAVERGGRTWRVHRAARRVPIYLAAEGPRTLELAGRVADGVIVGLGLTPEVIRLSLAAIERGVRAAGRAPADVDVWWFAKTSLADRRDAAVEPIKMALARQRQSRLPLHPRGQGGAARAARADPGAPARVRRPSSRAAGRREREPARSLRPDRVPRRPLRHRGHPRRMRGPDLARDGRGRPPVRRHRLRARPARLHAPVGQGGGGRALTLSAGVGLLFTLLIGIRWRASMWRRPRPARPASVPQRI